MFPVNNLPIETHLGLHQNLRGKKRACLWIAVDSGKNLPLFDIHPRHAYKTTHVN